MLEFSSHLNYVGDHERLSLEAAASDFAAFAAILDVDFQDRTALGTEFTDSWAETASETLANNSK